VGENRRLTHQLAEYREALERIGFWLSPPRSERDIQEAVSVLRTALSDKEEEE
jgi:hypothetical protein